MPKETDRLKLPLPLGNENVTRESINGIFEKIDAGVATEADLDTLREAVSQMDIPDASLTQKGKVQLSSKTDGTSETVAATEKAVRDASDKVISLVANDATTKFDEVEAIAKSYTDNKIGPLSSLQTASKLNTVAAINEVFQSGVNAKQGIVDALNAIGILASTNDTWSELISKMTKGDLFGISTGIPIERILEVELKSTMLLYTGGANDIGVCQDAEGNITYCYHDYNNSIWELRNITRNGSLRWKVVDKSGFTRCVVNDVTKTVVALISTYTSSWSYELKFFNKDTGDVINTISIPDGVYDIIDLDDYGNAYIKIWAIIYKYNINSGQLIYKVDTKNGSITYRPWSLDRKSGVLYVYGAGMIRKINENGEVAWSYTISDSQCIGLCAGGYNGLRVLYIRTLGTSAIALDSDNGKVVASFSGAFSGNISTSASTYRINNFVTDNQGGFISYSTSPDPSISNRHVPTVARSKVSRRKTFSFSGGWETYQYSTAGVFSARDVDIPSDLLFSLYGNIYLYKINYSLI